MSALDVIGKRAQLREIMSPHYTQVRDGNQTTGLGRIYQVRSVSGGAVIPVLKLNRISAADIQ